MTETYCFDEGLRSLLGQSRSSSALSILHSSALESLLSPGVLAKNADSWATPLSHRISIWGCTWGSLLLREADVLWIWEQIPEKGPWAVLVPVWVCHSSYFHWLLVRPGALYINKHQELGRLMNQVNSNSPKFIFSSHHLYVTANLG